MTLATNDDFASRELCIGELEMIAAGLWYDPVPGFLPPGYSPMPPKWAFVPDFPRPIDPRPHWLR